MYCGRGQRSRYRELRGLRMPSESAGTGSVEIKGLAGRSGRARTCDPRFWRPVLYQLSYTPSGPNSASNSRFFRSQSRFAQQNENGTKQHEPTHICTLTPHKNPRTGSLPVQALKRSPGNGPGLYTC